MIDSTNPRIMADNIKMLAASNTGGTAVEANPEGTATADLEKLGVNGTIYAIPVLNLSTTETKIGKYENEDLYACIIDCGNIEAGPGGKIITHGITGISAIIFYYGIGYNSADSAFNLLPRVDNDITFQRAMRVSATNIVVGGAANAQALTNVKAIIFYTKTASEAKKTKSKK